MGYPRNRQELWCDSDYARAIGAVELEQAEHRARYGADASAERVFEYRLVTFRAARAALEARRG